MGQTRWFRDVCGMSGLPQTAGISGHGRHFAFVPIVDTLKPLDHLVVAVWLTIQGARREGLRHLEEV
jgi:hypothetical protein